MIRLGYHQEISKRDEHTSFVRLLCFFKFHYNRYRLKVYEAVLRNAINLLMISSVIQEIKALEFF